MCLFVAGLLAAIVLAGLLALVSYRLWTYVIDKREYARFLNEKNNSKWNRVSFLFDVKLDLLPLLSSFLN